MRLGNISPSSTQTTGPHDMPNETTNRFAAISAITPDAPGRLGLPSTSVALAKMIDIVIRVTAMPDDPMSSSGLRPILSISAMAISVVATLMTDVITVYTADWSALKPTACQSTLE